MTEYTDFLSDSDAERVLLVEFDRWTSASPAVTREYVSSRTFRTGAADTPANKLYKERVLASPVMKRSMSEAFSGRSFFSIGYVDLAVADGDLDGYLDDSFGGREIVLKLGRPTWTISQFGTVLTGPA